MLHQKTITCAVAVVASVAAVSASYWIRPWMGGAAPFSLFITAVIVSAWIGGLLPGLVATSLSLGLAAYFIMPPTGFSAQQWAPFGIFFLNGCLVSAAFEVLKVSRQKAEDARKQVEQSRTEADNKLMSLLRDEQTARKNAERTAVLKDEFLATVSHEMRTPLTAILGWVQLLRGGSLASDTVPQALETIERNARAQAKLIDDLLDMSRILSGRLSLDLQRLNVAEAAESAIAAAEPAAAAKRVILVRQIAPGTKFVAGDSTRLQQILGNLLSNAIKFTPAGGAVTLSVRSGDSDVELRVHDTGEGITPEFLPHVFDRFRQQDASTVRNHQGLGLGLSIVKQLVEGHGGTIQAESSGPGEGATFTILLPIYGGTALQADANEVLPSLLGAKILVVEDDADVREVVRSILAQNGANVRTAASAADALTDFAARRPDILISDVGMPGQDGYDLIRQIRSLDRDAGGSTPAVALTAFARPDDRRRALAAGYHLHLRKPIEPSELVKAVASLVATKSSPFN